MLADGLGSLVATALFFALERERIAELAPVRS
jgi:hypothetical protein